MRFPSIPTIIRSFSIYNFSVARNSWPAAYKGLQTPVVRNSTVSFMPTIPFLSGFFGQQKDMTNYPYKKGEDYWEAKLSDEQFRIIRKKGTEAPFAGKYDKHMPSEGVYQCTACEAPIYRASHKFKSGCGWPAYYDSIPGAVTRHTDRALGMARTEIVCSRCGGHLGHIFKGEGYPTPTDERHCVNSVSLSFTDKNEDEIEVPK